MILMVSCIIFREESVPGHPGADFGHLRTKKNQTHFHNRGQQPISKYVLEILGKTQNSINSKIYLKNQHILKFLKISENVPDIAPSPLTPSPLRSPRNWRIFTNETKGRHKALTVSYLLFVVRRWTGSDCE